MKRSGEPRLVLRLKLPGGAILGPGKADLLERIDRLGSISAAAREMRMSFPRAWKLVQTMNEAFRRPVVRTETGGRRGGGAALTSTGRQALECYVSMRRKMEAQTGAERAVLARLARADEETTGNLARRRRRAPGARGVRGSATIVP